MLKLSKTNNFQFKILDSFTLKYIAMIAMLFDHIGYVFFPNITFFYLTGRLAFPIFAYLLVEGFEHTSDIKKYCLRMLFFAIISEMPFDLLFYGKLFFWEHQNTCFELLLGLITLILIQKNTNIYKRFFILLAMALIAILLRFDYDAFGILIIAMFYFHKENILIQGIGITVLSLFFINVKELVSVFSLIFLFLYNGKQVNKKQQVNKTIKYTFYMFYPLHIIFLWIIKSLLLL